MHVCVCMHEERNPGGEESREKYLDLDAVKHLKSILV